MLKLAKLFIILWEFLEKLSELSPTQIDKLRKPLALVLRI